jgi:2'-5' RNA ligase
MIKYRTAWNEIEALEVSRETKAQVVRVIGSHATERREAKRSEYYNWHDTWEDAHAFLIERAEAEVQALRNQLEQAKGRLGNIKGMKPSKANIKQD